MLNLVREGEEDYIEAICYRCRLKIFENFLFGIFLPVHCTPYFYALASPSCYTGSLYIAM